MHEDFHGNFWVGTEKGIFQYQPAFDDFTQPIPVNNATVRSICSDEGLLWFILSDELYYYDIAKKIVRKQFIPGIKTYQYYRKIKMVASGSAQQMAGSFN
ncbi:hypothetical protein [Niabella ginsengisoli]|uniref:hypothetical protein n=1 Tax=Niabella ginsengisoli TaxID=522298 RepID=UPI00374D7395